MSNTYEPNDKKVTCLYCGNNPVSHFSSLLDSYLFSILNPLAHGLLSTPLGRPAVFLIDSFFLVFFNFGKLIGVARYEDIDKPLGSDRGQVLFDEAQARGYKMQVLTVFGRSHDSYKVIFPDGKSLRFDGVPRVSRHNALYSAWIDDKAKIKKRLQKHNVPVPAGGCVNTWLGARLMFNKLTKPVIIKPRFGSRGRHTTTNISNLADFKIAYKRAGQLCWQSIVEEHYIGSVYRGTCIDGKLAGVLAGDPPRITGDGVSTIASLIELKNKNRNPRVSAVVITDKHIEFLAMQGYTLETVLPNGLEIDISEKIGLSYGGSSREMIDVTHPKLVAALEKAAQAVGDPILGFDFITPSVEADPDTVRWGIIECNSVPFINLHHDPLLGTPVNVAAKVWDWVEREMRVGK